MYPYTAHLVELERRRPGGVEKVLPKIPEWRHILCPMVSAAWEQCLRDHPDKAYSSYLINRILVVDLSHPRGRSLSDGASPS